ncbi:glycophorin-C isoform X1 [Hyaena hyaena]|uniref:glycophorin-C isoform X1 n=2 Tax=Hyaena hyaena TaxID=95912 RepID=UPI0019221A90|nr:glycophorin-C isoform X1 [Hyaena hyaena]
MSSLNSTSSPEPEMVEPDIFMTLGVNIAIIAGVIAAIAIILICLLVIILRYLYGYKGTYHTNEAKGTEFAESADAALQEDPSLQDTGGDNRKEYFI